MNGDFGIKDTNICKGIAIILMVFHHAVGKYYNGFDLSWYTSNSINFSSLLLLMFSSAGKVCVSLLTILSGYGIFKKYSIYVNTSNNPSDVRFILSRLIKFYSIYVPIFLLTLIAISIRWFSSPNDLILFYDQTGNIYLAIAKIIIDLFGLYGLFNTPSMLNNWFVTAIIILYILFPVIRYLTKKYKLVFVVLCNIPWVILMLQGGIKIDVFYCYLGEFALGIYFANSGILDELKRKVNKKTKLYSLLFLIVSFGLRIICGLSADIILAIALIVFEITTLSETKTIYKLFILFGVNSANIWLIHSMVNGTVIRFVQERILQTLIVLLISLLISIVIEKLKKIMKIDSLTNRINRKLLA